MADNDLGGERRTDTSAHPGPSRIVGVYRDEESAKQAARAAEAAGGTDVSVGAEADRVSSLRGEMQEETEHAWGGPSVGLYTKEMARSLPLWTGAATAIGILVALPFAFIEFGDLPLLTRLIIAAVSGAFFGGTIGFLVAGGFFERRRKTREELAGEDGVVVGVTDGDGRAAEAMAQHAPIRLDRIAPDGQPEDTLFTEN